jgi:hypothetical protein
MARTCGFCATAATQKLLYDAIFKAVEGDDCQAATWLQHAFGSLKAVS